MGQITQNCNKLLFFLLICLIGCDSGYELNWNEKNGYRWANVKPDFFGSAGFEKVGSNITNIYFSNSISKESLIENRNIMNGSGVALGDVNGNGLIDIYFASIEGSNKLYKNLGGFNFVDVTESSGVTHEGYKSTGVTFIDINGNGHLDLLVATLGQGISLYINDGTGNFELNEDSGLDSNSGNHTLALADINGSGYLDLYVVNYKKRSVRDIFDIRELFLENIVRNNNDSLELISPFDEYFTLFINDGNPDPREHGEIDELFINQGNGFFKKVETTEEYFMDEFGSPLGLKPDWGLSAKFQDLNGNGYPDLYVANDFWTHDRIWINRGDGTFRAINQHSFRQFSYSSMDVDFSDINRNGMTDIFITEMLNPKHELRVTQSVNISPKPISIGDTKSRALHNHNSLYLNIGTSAKEEDDPSYIQTALFSGVAMSGWSWGTRFIDIDLDGYEDIIITTGMLHDGRDYDTQELLAKMLSQNQLDSRKKILEYPNRELKNIIFRNNGDITFTEQSSDWGFYEKDIAQGLAVADLNNNGVLDVVMNRMNSKASIYRNKTNAPRIAVRLKGNHPNTQGIGAKIKLEGGPVIQSKEISAGGDYLSGSDPMVVFAADKNNNQHVLTVEWPDGKKTSIENVIANRVYEIHQSLGNYYPNNNVGDKSISYGPLFKDASELINHKHFEVQFDDFQVQPLLPYSVSQQGPGVSWIDINRNGYDDLFISSGKGGKTAVYENNGNGTFNLKEITSFNDTKTISDQTAIIGWGEGEGVRIIVGIADYNQDDLKNASAFDLKILPRETVVKQELHTNSSVTGHIAAADYNGNGYVDLFIGGRFIPGSYPVNTSSHLFINDGENFKIDKKNSDLFEDVGLVTAATFVDINNNGKQDLLLSTEWGSLRLFENVNGIFQEITKQVGIDKYKGWWTGVAVGDLTNNGLPDIVAANIGLNSVYGNVFTKPLKIYYGDFNWDGRVNVIEAYFNESNTKYLPLRKLYELDVEIPQLTRSIRNHRDFSEISVEELLQLSDLNTQLDDLPSKEINTLEHMVFINNGYSFSIKPLPVEAQLSAAFHVGIADFDNDGNEDIFLSQNNFSFANTTPRLDSGRGLILNGNGKGEFKSLSRFESGIEIYGQQGGAAFSDFNKNGKTDIAISQTGSQTKLYINQTEKIGISVRLIGTESNRDAIGSSVRIIYEDGKYGPTRYIQAGSGYLSQNSRQQILGYNAVPKELEIKWFDGTTQSINLMPSKNDYEIYYQLK